MALKGLHVYVTGKVQGVFFRHHTLLEAKKLGLTGWVKNLFDGRVEALFEGEAELLNKMLGWCQKGTPGSYVTDVEHYEKDYTGAFKDFTINN